MKRIFFLFLALLIAPVCFAGGPQSQVTFNDLTGTVGIANGGTGATASSAALAALGGERVGSYVHILARSAADVTLANSTLTQVVAATEELDTHNAWSVSTFTVPITGLYRLRCSWNMTGSGVAGTGHILLYKGGSEATPLRRAANPFQGSGGNSLSNVWDFEMLLTAGDQYSFFQKQDSGGNMTVYASADLYIEIESVRQ